jgi:hypothetical protein
MVGGNGSGSKICGKVFWGDGCPLVCGVLIGIQGCVKGGALLAESGDSANEDFDGTPTLMAGWSESDHFTTDPIFCLSNSRATLVTLFQSSCVAVCQCNRGWPWKKCKCQMRNGVASAVAENAYSLGRRRK